MKIIDCIQGSGEWLERRAGLPTASEWDALVSPTGEIRSGQIPRTYLARKVAEAWAGPLLGFGQSWFMEQGSLLEKEIIPWCTLEYGWKMDRVGLCLTDDERFGCSPDALIDGPGGPSGVEIKAPSSEVAVKYILAHEVPPEYRIQIQGCMFVTGRSHWWFVSYNRNFPAFVMPVYRDEKIQAALAEVLPHFRQKLDGAIEYLTELNGGERPPRVDTTQIPYNAWRESLSRQADEHQNPVGIIP